ncbi:hypothetical protein NIES4071_26830 [Calothrix sp. NIES-4071]|nr:hypothetical protein NIES4071_26830 [Calothrix sp. NIES-4071]BAZ57005.1 hypothetical protein NIES4105_26770 [Calothrix sp. NIES-4105]
MKKLLVSALIVVSTFICIAPEARAFSLKSTNESSISNDKQVVARLADRGKPSNPIPAGRR